MVSWLWILAAVFVGFLLGAIGIGVLAAGRDECCYRQGFCEGLAEGHEAGFQDGIKSIGGVG